jgi:hypothetical protein
MRTRARPQAFRPTQVRHDLVHRPRALLSLRLGNSRTNPSQLRHACGQRGKHAVDV